MNKDFTFIHIGKCGGSTIEAALEQNNFNFCTIHVRPAKYKPDMKYLIALRNPVDRFISAFYWRKYLLESGAQNNPDELRFLQKYENIDGLCSHLYAKNSNLNLLVSDEINRVYGSKEHPEHYAMGLHYYIGEFVGNCIFENVIGVICTETLNCDIKRIFGISCDMHKKNNRKHKQTASEQSRSTLRKYLNKDYEVVEHLNSLNMLSEKQYQILSK